MKRSIQSPEAPTPVGPYSQAVAAAGLLFVSGQLGLDPQTGLLVAEEAAAQTEQACANLLAILAAASLGAEQLLKTTVFLTDRDDLAAVNAAYGRRFAAVAPARSTVIVAALPLGAKVEIEAVACLLAD